MSIRYLFNTGGKYVGFISNQNVFTPMCKWIGFLPEANVVYDLDGIYIGEISPDDRIIRNKTTKYPRLNRPMRPMRPLKRLRMPKLPYPYEDVFDDRYSNLKADPLIKKYSYLLGTNIFASDENNTFLGNISNNRFEQNSILNRYGTYGSRYSNTSIFNQYCLFGGEYSQFSPFNQYSNTPPKISQRNQFVAWLTVNKFLSGNIIDANEFFSWLSSLN